MKCPRLYVLGGLLVFAAGCRSPSPAPASLPGAQTQVAAATRPGLRLGDSVVPRRYDAELAIDPASDRFTGRVAIDVVVGRPTTTVWLNAADLDIRGARVRTASGTVPARARMLPEGLLALEVDAPLSGSVTLHVDYDGQLRREGTGLLAERIGADAYVFTQLEPLAARRVFPCFDDPALKARWRLRLRVPGDVTALANAPLASTTRDGNARIVTFEETPPLPTYLVAFAVGPFDLVDVGPVGAGHAPLRIATPRGRAADAAYARTTAPQLLERLEAYFGSPYPFSKLDLVAIPSMEGAMENPGLVTFDQRLLLASAREESTSFRKKAAWVMAHELAHQWLGNLVTMQWWDDLWLNESLADWMAQKEVGALAPGWGADAQGAREALGAMSDDALPSAHSVREPIHDRADVEMAFDGITYGKGAAVVRSFERWIGEDVFRAGVRRHVETHRFGSVRADDLFAALSAAAGRDVAGPLSTFLDQPGVPMLRVRLACDGAKPRVVWSQERYRLLGSNGDAGHRWQVPFCTRYEALNGEEARTCALLDGAQGELTLDRAACPSWIVAHDGGSGYYHVAYDPKLLAALTSAPRGRLSTAEIVALLGDVDASVRVGALSYADALPLVVAVAEGADTRAAIDAARFIDGLSREELVDDASRPAYARFVRRTFGTRVAALGWRTRADDGDDERTLRRLLVPFVAGEGEDRALRSEAVKLAERALAGEELDVAADLMTPLFAAAARSEDPRFFETLVGRLRSTPKGAARHRLLVALGELRDPSLAARRAKLVLDPDLAPREGLQLLEAAFSFPSTRDDALGFLATNIDALSARFPADERARVVLAVGGLCDRAAGAEVESLLRPRLATIDGGERAMRETMDRIHLCAAHRALGAPQVASYLARARAR